MTPSPGTWSEPVTQLRGVGPERAALLARLGLLTLGDLLLHRPHRHEDRRHIESIANLQAGMAATVQGTIVALGVKRWRHGARSVFELILEDGTSRLHCRWWNMPYLEAQFRTGETLIAHGRVVDVRPRTMDHPEIERFEADDPEPRVHVGRLVPVYPLTEGVSQRWLRGLIWRVLQTPAAHPPEPAPGRRPPELPTRAEALRQLHFPEAEGAAERARRRLAFDEFLELQLTLQTRRQRLEQSAPARPCPGDNRLIRPFLARLGFTLTPAQVSVLREIRQDLGRPIPMRRLLQGDVGSGKTVVAACAALMALESGLAAVLMAPTALLAEQHASTFSCWFAPLGLGVQLVTADHPAPPVHPGRQPKPALIIGTHALLEPAAGLPDPGLVIIDEQHKFGVAQREHLVRKTSRPHLLVMTATPIPRTLGLTLYGDLDVSTLDALPGGRGGVRTFVRTEAQLPKVWEFVRQRLAEGRQAYVVYPRIAGSDEDDIKGVTAGHARLEKVFAPQAVGLLHGRLDAAQRDQVMRAFSQGHLAVLVATSIVEVGVDVPNASLLVVVNAEQFGLAQLHQLRGRISRGSHAAQCILVAHQKTDGARQRLAVLEATADGFAIAEEDLRLRGPGELLGRSQSGTPVFRFADLTTDRVLLERAREQARAEIRLGEPAAGDTVPA